VKSVVRSTVGTVRSGTDASAGDDGVQAVVASITGPGT
jgi:hypothetical protein